MRKRTCAMLFAVVCTVAAGNPILAGGQEISGAAAGSKSNEEKEQEDAWKDALSSLINPADNVLPGAWIAVESKGTSGEFWSLVQTGMQDAVSAINEVYQFSKSDRITMTFEGPSEETDVTAQINVLDAIIAENPAVLCLSASDVASCQAQLEAAKENGIPVVIFDSTVLDQDLITAYCATDNQEVGYIAGEKLLEALGTDGGSVAVFSAQEKTSSVIERMEGFQRALKQQENAEIVEVVYQDQVDNFEEAVRQVLEQYPTLAGVYCTNADSSDLYLTISKDLRDGIVFVGTDATTSQQAAIREGEELGCVSQNPYELGYRTIVTAVALTSPPGTENEVETSIVLEPRWLDADNLDDPENAGYVYGK